MFILSEEDIVCSIKSDAADRGKNYCFYQELLPHFSEGLSFMDRAVKAIDDRERVQYIPGSTQ